jgi:hypothetical protein
MLFPHISEEVPETPPQHERKSEVPDDASHGNMNIRHSITPYVDEKDDWPNKA